MFMMKHMTGLGKYVLPMVVMLLVVMTSSHAMATGTPTPTGGAAADVCTSFGERMDDIFGTGATTPTGAADQGILSQIYLFITGIVDGATQKIFESFTDNSGYQKAVYAATILSVVLFGVFFTIGLVQLTAGQLLVRLFKIGIIFSVVSAGGWTFFSQYAVAFFNDGTDELVKGVLQIASGGAAPPAGSTPFYQLDRLGEFIINPDTLIAVIGSLTSGPFGMGMGALMMMSFGAFIMMLVAALRSYAVCYVVRSLLLGLAPIFIVFLLFERTKQLFNSWLNSLISCSLQPILLFTFLAFFVVMMESATKNMFSAELCYVEFEQLVGTSNRAASFRFVDPATGEIMTDESTFRGNLSCLLRSTTGVSIPTGTPSGSGTPECAEFPIKIIDIMTFLMLVFLASRFSEVIDRVANELSNTFIQLDPAGKFDQFMSESGRAFGSSGTPNTPPPPAAPSAPPANTTGAAGGARPGN